MFYKLIAYLTTPSARYVRSMEYLYQAVALRGRYKRRAAAWQPHLDKTKEFILSSGEKCRTRDKLIVLGSGLLLDVPIESLVEKFREVVLVDVVHLPEVRKRMKQYNNVRLIQGDITNVAEKLFTAIRQGRSELPLSEPSIPDIDAHTSLVISLNILSQLAAVPQDYVQKKRPEISQEQLDVWCDQIREAHYQKLATLPCDVCLIADHEYVYKNKQGDVIEQGSTVGKVILPKPDTSWWWEIAPFGEASKDYSKELFVGAWHLPCAQNHPSTPADTRGED
jgi:hypothetical protein